MNKAAGAGVAGAPSGGVLSRGEILRRGPEIFEGDTWSEDSVMETAYELSIDEDFMIVGGKRYFQGTSYSDPFVHIAPGEIALFSTIEAFQMPLDIAGRIGIKFRYTRKGLVPLFGAQVDPGYGRRADGTPYGDERLYLVVCNLGNRTINLELEQRVFTLEFHTIVGDIQTLSDRPYVREIVKQEYFASDEPQQNLGFLDRLNDRLDDLENGLDSHKVQLDETKVKIDAVQHGMSSIVFFGVFLVAATLFGVTIATLIGMLLISCRISASPG